MDTEKFAESLWNNLRQCETKTAFCEMVVNTLDTIHHEQRGIGASVVMEDHWKAAIDVPPAVRNYIFERWDETDCELQRDIVLTLILDKNRLEKTLTKLFKENPELVIDPAFR